MKRIILFFAMLLSVMAVSAKDIKTVVFTTNPVMHCASCEDKIKTNLRYEKGVKSIATNVAEQRVTVNYDAAKTSAEKIQKAFGKFGYEAKVVECGEATAEKGCCGKKKEAPCCKEEKRQSCCGD